LTTFADSVAARAGVHPDVVAETLAAHGIREWLPASMAAPLRIERVAFEGFKDLSSQPPGEQFEFSWDVPDGVSALASNENFAGKTSVIEIIRWLLSGRSAVDRWVFDRLTSAQLVFSIGDQKFTVAVERRGDGLAGQLMLDGNQVRPFDEETFEQIMEELLLPRLGLERIGTFQRGAGSVRGAVTQSGWPLLIEALCVRPSELGTLIGGVGNLAGQLLQVYLALPWYDTLLQARAALGEAKQIEGDTRKALLAQAEVRASATEGTRKELEVAEQRLAELVSGRDLTARLEASAKESARLVRLEMRAASRVESAKAGLAAAEGVRVVAERALRNFDEREAAGNFFRALEPQACPRCATLISIDRREREADHGVCSVCDREAHYEPDPTERDQLQEQVAATELAVEDATRALAEETEELTAYVADQTKVRSEVEELSNSDALRVRRSQEDLVSRLRGRLDEREDTERLIVNADADSATPTGKVLQAVVDEGVERVKGSGEIFEDLGREILDLGQRFGISGLTEVRIDRAAHLPVVKEGTKYNFGRLPDGDKLRLKVAVAIALLRVGRRRGAGQHPGLLFVDSPGAEEVETGSLSEMIAELDRVAEDVDLQVIIASARLDDVRTVLDQDRLRTPRPGSTKLW
jgi:hypothetical protein